MSYQLVSLCSIESEGNTSYKVLAQSADIPEPLLHKLRGGPGSMPHAAPNYHYHIVQLQGGANYHILTALSPLNEQQCLEHFLVLTAEEVSAMQKNASRPTPAGLCLALNNIDFWYRKPIAAPYPQYIEGTPKLTASSIPDASTQDTWKRMTGHKSNVKSLISASYAAKCALKMPRESSAQDALLLMHESMWLTNYRGWGKSFSTTPGTAADIVVVYTETELEAAQTSDTSCTILKISSDMEYAEFEQAESEVCEPGVYPHVSSATPHFTATQSETYAEPYKYVEAPDYETFDIDSPEHPNIRSSKYIAALFVLLLLVYISVSSFVDFASDDVPESVADTEITSYSYQRFAEIIKNKTAGDDDFHKLEALLKRHQNTEHELLIECIHRLDKADSMTSGHAEELQLLLRHSDSLGVSDAMLSTYYMKRVLQEYPLDEWIHTNSTQHALQTWSKLFKAYPQLPGVFMKEPAISAHMQPIIKAVKLQHRH